MDVRFDKHQRILYDHPVDIGLCEALSGAGAAAAGTSFCL